MINIDRDAGYIFLSRCDYLYRNGLDNRDDLANQEMGDGDICIRLPEYMQSREFDGVADRHGRTKGSDGQGAEIIVNEIRRRLGCDIDESLPWDGVYRLKWTGPRDANSEIGYWHMIAESPLGRFVLVWKPWKDDYWRRTAYFVESPWGHATPDLDSEQEYKRWAEIEMWKRVHRFLAGAEQIESK